MMSEWDGRDTPVISIVSLWVYPKFGINGKIYPLLRSIEFIKLNGATSKKCSWRTDVLFLSTGDPQNGYSSMVTVITNHGILLCRWRSDANLYVYIVGNIMHHLMIRNRSRLSWQSSEVHASRTATYNLVIHGISSARSEDRSRAQASPQSREKNGDIWCQLIRFYLRDDMEVSINGGYPQMNGL